MINNEDWSLGPKIGQGSSAIVFMATNSKTNETGAIKVINLEDWERGQIDELRREIQLMTLCQHPDLLPIIACWVKEHSLYILTPLMAGGSCLDVMKSLPSLKEGLNEETISIILLQALQGLDYLHKHGHMHRDIKAANLLLSAEGVVHLADFGVSSSLLEEVGVSANGLGRRTIRNLTSPVSDNDDSNESENPFFQCPSHLSTIASALAPPLISQPLPSRRRTTFVGTPCWMAPEIMEMGLEGYDQSADIWSFGITALELANGHAPLSHLPPMKVIQLSIQNPPPTLDRKLSKHKYSKTFKEMIDLCLCRTSTKRPSTSHLLKHPFFLKAQNFLEKKGGKTYIKDNLLSLLPSELTERPRIKRLNIPTSNPPLIDSMLPIMNHSNSIEALDRKVEDWDFSSLSDGDENVDTTDAINDVVLSGTKIIDGTTNISSDAKTIDGFTTTTCCEEVLKTRSLRNSKQHSIGRFVVEGFSGDEDSSNHNDTMQQPSGDNTETEHDDHKLRDELQALSPAQSQETFQKKGRFDVNNIPLILDNVDPEFYRNDSFASALFPTTMNGTNNEDGRRSRFQIDAPKFETLKFDNHSIREEGGGEGDDLTTNITPEQRRDENYTKLTTSAEDLRFLLIREQMESQSLQYQIQLQALQQEKLLFQLQLQQIKEQQIMTQLSDTLSSGGDGSGCVSRTSICLSGGGGSSSIGSSRSNSLIKANESPFFYNPFASCPQQSSPIPSGTQILNMQRELELLRIENEQLKKR